jgi:hypothetical protein
LWQQIKEGGGMNNGQFTFSHETHEIETVWPPMPSDIRELLNTIDRYIEDIYSAPLKINSAVNTSIETVRDRVLKIQKARQLRNMAVEIEMNWRQLILPIYVVKEKGINR